MTVLKCLWRVLDFCRRLVLNLIFLGVLAAAALIWLFARPNTPAVEPGTLLVLDLDGTVVESDPLRSISADLKSLMKSRGASTRLIDVTEALRFAGSDERIAGVIIKVDGLTKLGLASARTIGSAIEDYKTASGKPVFSWASGYTQAQYAAAAHADVVALHPMGSVMVKGLSGTTLYWGGFLEKLGIGVSVFKAGAFKSAPEAYSLRAPTTDNLIAQEGYLSEAWKVFASDLEDARGLIPGSVDTYLKGLPERLNAGESPAEAAKAAGLITDLMAREAFDETLAKQFGGGNLKNVKTVNFGAYLAETARSRSAAQPGAVAVVLAEGAISSTGATGIDAEELVQRIERAASAPSTKALVLRISSPGGDALAAEAIREKLAAVRTKGLPVIVSMGNAAASGGYWISLAADRIVADPLTLTGSIGVFSIVPDAAAALEKLELGIGGFRTSDFADFGSPLHKPNAAEAALLRAGVMRTYARFKDLTAQSRKKTPEAVEALAQGRIWMGTQAAQNGLVDKLGDLNDAVKLARQVAGLKTNEPIRIYDVEADAMTSMLSGVMGEAMLKVFVQLPITDFLQLRNIPIRDAEAALLSSGRTLAWSPAGLDL